MRSLARHLEAMGEFEQEEITTLDGYLIVSRSFAREGAARGGVLIVPAMGVAQSYYEPFAAWLADRGYVAVTFDFRGIGLSRAGPLRALKTDILSWARFDCAAVLDRLAERIGDTPLYWIGHSLGGQIIPLVPNWGRVSKFITIATGSGYWRENAPPLNRYAWFLWYFLAPLTVALFGYFPGRRLRLVGDLPAGVIKQWRRWCLNPDYAVGVEREARSLYAAVRTPIVSLSFSDDEFMSRRNIESIHGFFKNAPRTMTRLTPHDVGVARIGHFGFFRPAFAESLWHGYLLPQLSG